MVSPNVGRTIISWRAFVWAVLILSFQSTPSEGATSSLKSPDLTVYASDACWWLMASAATSPAMELRNASCAKASRMVNMPAPASQRVTRVAAGRRHRLRVARGVLGIRHIDMGFAKNSAVCSECPCRGAFAQLLLPGDERYVSGMRGLVAHRSPCRNCFLGLRRQLRNGIAVLGLIGPRTQAACSQRTIRGGTAQSSRRHCIRHTLFPPLTGAGAESSLEANIEEAQVVETAFFSHVDDFGIG